MASLFPACLRGISRSTVPRLSLKKQVHPLRSFASTSEFVADPVPLPIPKNQKHLPWNFVLYRDVSNADTSVRRASNHSSPFRPQCSSHSRRFAPRGASRVYFTSKPRLRFTLQGLSLLPSRCISSIHRALMPLTTLAYHSPKRITPATAVPSSGPCAYQQSVTTSRAVSPTNNPIPS